MTTPDEAQALLPVTPEDRDAASAAYYDCYETPPNALWMAKMENGGHDDDCVVQAFARHRISHSLPGEGMRDELERLLGVYEHNKAMNICGGHDNGQMIRDCFIDDLVALFEPAALTPSALSGDAGEGELRAALAKRTSMSTIAGGGQRPHVEIRFANVADAHALTDAILNRSNKGDDHGPCA